MREVIEALLVLQDRDQKIRSVQQQLAAVPRERKSLDDKLAAARVAMEQAKQRSKENEVDRRKLEVDVQAKQTSIARFKTQQQATRKNEEFQALNHEIAHFNGEISALEDKELVLMEEAEGLKKATLEAEEELARAQASIKDQLARLEAGAVTLGERLKELQSDHASLKANIPEEPLALYQRLIVRKGDSAISPLDHEICGGCHMKVPTQVAVQVRMSQGVPQCPNCGRILYRVL